MQHAPVRQDAPDVASVLIVDDHPLFSDALASALEVMFEGCEIRKSRCLQEALALAQSGFAPDLVMFDLKLPDVTGLSGFRRLRECLPDARVLVISSLASFELVHCLLDEGAAGFLPKDASASELRAVVAEIGRGGRHVPREYFAPSQRADAGEDVPFDHPILAGLTPQQQRIMRLICKGKPNKQIAYELDLAEATVKAHITALLRRLGASNRTEAVVLVEQALSQSRADEPEARAFLRQ